MLLLGALTLSTALAPGPANVRALAWDAPAACASRAQLESAIAGMLGRPLADEDATALTVRGTARRRSDGRWQLWLGIAARGAGTVERTAIAEECALLTEAAALMIAVAIDPALAGGEALRVAPTSRAPRGIPLAVVAAARASVVDPPPLRPSPTSADRPRRWPLRGVVSAGAGLDVGALPGPAAGLLVRAGLLARRLRVELGAVHWFARRAEIAGANIGGDLRLTAAQLQVCPRLVRKRLELPLCAGLELGVMRGVGIGLPVNTSDRVTWLAALAGGRLLWAPVPRLALGLELGLAVPLLAARFRVGGLDRDLHKAAPAAFRGGLGLELRFP